MADWHCKQILNGQQPIVVCEREVMLDEVERLRAERDASQLIISDLTAQLERQRAAILLLGLADIERLAADNERLRDERRTERGEVERLRAEVAVLRDELRLAGQEARRG